MHFLIGRNLLYYAVLISAIQQCKSAPIIDISPPLEPPSPPPTSPLYLITECQAGFPVLYIYSSFSPAICLQ